MMQRFYIVIILVLTVFTTAAYSSVNADVEELLKDLDGITIERVTTNQDGHTVVAFFFQQMLDHASPDRGTFNQYVILTHRGYDRPAVLVTEGYSLGRNYCSELHQLLEANEIRVEHRFFGKSIPEGKPLQFLTVRQAVDDYHRIVTVLKSIYRRPWVSCGWSKGGQTAVVYRRFYPSDMIATVAYDSPFNHTIEDVRLNYFFDEVGSALCRERLIKFQRLVLLSREKLKPFFNKYKKEKKLTFNRLGYDKALEYIVLEYPFSFWQYNKIDCNEIPCNGSKLEDVFNHLEQVVAFSSYSDRAFDSVAMHQFFSELGYYGNVKKNVEDLLSTDFHYSNGYFAPQGIETPFKVSFMEDINRWIYDKGDAIIFIYGRNDPWAAAFANVSAERDSLVLWLPGGNHYTFIKNLPEKGKILALTYLRYWIQRKAVGVEIYPGLSVFFNEKEK